ncbi:10-deacetylbaccatin III 10-O-acetyltransferase-like [Canna indica]|uniref:10-deacetylbaccatin III 10-O-acetyltransferase-like n=1 Tax=Canna indica TaxID=4628 RepID=A0AAQ3JZK4_9LILI|nr:10-deacetylbaccatin III 10-O-acetyltransferase-like [Canna indica]
MGFTVTKSPSVLVPPSAPTPPGDLPLSSIDRTAAVRSLVDMMLVYDHGDNDPANFLKRALSMALVAYFPIAGRLVQSTPGDLHVACTGDGVWFVEAAADCTLQQVNNLELPRMIPKPDLLPSPPPEVDLESLIFLMQVTRFSCGGFVVSMRSSHVVLDGLGAAQFLKAIAEMARGLPALSTAPIWSRDSIPSPAKLPPRAPLLSFTSFPFITCSLDLSVESITKIKNQFISGTGHNCSTFDAVTALFWQCRTRAVGMDPAAEVSLGFAINIRHLLGRVLPRGGGGYYGNGVFPMAVRATCGVVAIAPLAEVVHMIRGAKERADVKFAGWMAGEEDEDSYRAAADYAACFVADWRTLGFSELDYGWGDPVNVVPLIDDCNLVASCILMRPPAPAQGVRLIARCVVKEHLAAFTDEVMKLTEDLY